MKNILLFMPVNCHTVAKYLGGSLMKKTFVFVVLTMVFVSSLAAQSATADAQRIIGTWTVIEGNRDIPVGAVLIFNANGTGIARFEGETDNFHFGISTNGEIWLWGDVIPLFFSPDGRRMILYEVLFQKN